jgi:HK97 family phage portal protein
MNGRTALGAGLVLLAVLAGALFLDRSQRLVPVYAAARDPKPGGAKDLQAAWMNARKGNRAPAVLHGARFEPISVRPEESQFLATLDSNVNAVARLYGVPPEMVGGSTAGPLAYTSPEMRSLDLLTYTVRGWLVRLENAITALLPSNQHARFNAGGMVRVDLKTRYEAHAIAIAAGFLTVNEVRALEDRGPLPETGAVA